MKLIFNNLSLTRKNPQKGRNPCLYLFQKGLIIFEPPQSLKIAHGKLYLFLFVRFETNSKHQIRHLNKKQIYHRELIDLTMVIIDLYIVIHKLSVETSSSVHSEEHLLMVEDVVVKCLE
jgi:hypothetical protein